jgi:hypothetical protein
MNEKISESLNEMLHSWKMMQHTAGDEGAEFAEMFERLYYEFIAHLKEWFNKLEQKPLTVEEAETLPEIEHIFSQIPGPLHINLLTDIEEIIEGIETKRFD